MDADEACPGERRSVDSPRRTRLYTFPGGVFEMNDYGDDDGPGFYLEFRADRGSASPLGAPALPQRLPGVIDTEPVAPADTETCRQVLRLLREL